MVLLPDMGQFVDNHIIDDGRRSHHQAPSQGQDVSRGAGTPTAGGIADAETFGMEPPCPAVSLDPIGEIGLGLSFVPGPDERLSVAPNPVVQ